MQTFSKIIIAFFFLFLSFQVGAEDKDDASPQLIETLKNIETFRARFNQKIHDANGENISKSRGEIVVRRPGKFYWKSEAPDPVLVIGDGKHLWTYDIDLAQVTKQGMQEALGDSPATLLSGSVTSINNNYSVKNANLSKCSGSDECYMLHPRSKDASIADILIGFSKGKLVEIRMHDSLGQDVQTTFTGVKINQTVESKLFDFVPPKGVDVIQAKS